MQEFSHPNGSRRTDVIYGRTLENLRTKLIENEAARVAEGYNKVEERMLTPNSKCTCGSGKKIKRCCKFL